MRLKLTKSFSLTFLLFGLFLYGCLDEPFIEPVKGTFSVIRVVNLSNNVNNMKVTINGETPVASLNAISSPVINPDQSPMTEYFDIPAGKKRFRVFNEAGVEIYSNEIEIISWERITIVISGFYSEDPLQNTLGNFEFNEGEVYVDYSPNAGTSHVYFLHGSAPVGDFDSRTYTSITANFTPVGGTPRDTTFSQSGLSFGNIVSLGNLPAGDYTFTLVSTAGNHVYSTTIGPNLMYYMYLYDAPNSLQIYRNEVSPPPVRERG